MSAEGIPVPWRLRLVDDRLFPVQAFFNAFWDDNFVEVMRGLLGGIGHSMDDAHCRFPSDLDPWEEPFEGVRFSLYEDEVIITAAELKAFVAQACVAYLAAHPEQRDVVADLLSSA